MINYTIFNNLKIIDNKEDQLLFDENDCQSVT